MSDDQIKHYHLASARVLFQDENNTDVAITDVNGLIVGDQKNIGTKELGKIQQTVQVNLFQRLGSPVNVVGITIIAITYLGAMTEKEFNNASPADLGEEVPAQVN